MAKITSPSRLPLREQLALKFLGHALLRGPVEGDARAAVDRAYEFGDAFLDRARENWRIDRGITTSADAEAVDTDDENDDEPAAEAA